MRYRIGIPRFPWGGHSWLGLPLFGLIVLPWLPIFGPPEDARPARRIRGLGDAPILAFAFAPDGATIATIQMDGRVPLRDAAGGAGAPSLLEHHGFALALAFSPDGRSLAVSGAESDLVLHDVRAGGAGHPLGMPIRAVCDPAFSPDGRLLAASSYLDPEILLWDLATGRERARLRGHESPVISLAFAPDGRSLASGVRAIGRSSSGTSPRDSRDGGWKCRPALCSAWSTRRTVAGWHRPTISSARSGCGTWTAGTGTG
jgi:WD40 repeat protein